MDNKLRQLGDIEKAINFIDMVGNVISDNRWRTIDDIIAAVKAKYNGATPAQPTVSWCLKHLDRRKGKKRQRIEKVFREGKYLSFHRKKTT